MSNRIEKILSVAKRDIARFILENHQNQESIITVSNIATNADFSNFRIGLSFYPEKDKQLENFIRSIRFKLNNFQKTFAKKHHLKKIPKLDLVLNQNQDQIDNVDKLLNQIENERY